MSSGRSKGFFGALLGIAGAAIGGPIGFAIGIGGVALSNVGARQLQREAQKRARNARAQDPIRGNVRGSHEHHLMVFGKARVGGIVVTVGTADGADMANQDLYLGIAHSICHAGGCEGIEDIWIDDTRIDSANINGSGLVTSGDQANLVTVTHYRGTATQSADATLVSEGIDNTTDFRRGIAWTLFKLHRPNNEEQFQKGYKFGIPTCTVELKGIRCYDPRLDDTEGGSGSQRKESPTTWAWTANPALCAATYMIMEESDGGMGVPTDRIDWASVAAAANICDETASFSGSPSELFTRYQCNGVLTTADRRETNLQKLLDCMNGRRVRVGGKYKLYAGAYSVPTVEIDKAWLAGPVRVISRSPLEALYNAVRVTFDNAEEDYKTVEAPAFTSSTYEAQDGDFRVWRDLALPMCSNTRQAQYIAQVVGNQSRQQMIVELTCNLKALDVEVWETATLDLPELDLSDRVFRVVEWSFTPAGMVALTLQQDAASVYAAGAFQQQQTGTAPDVGVVTPPTILNLAADGVLDGIRLTWDQIPISLHDRVQVQRAADSGGSPSAASGSYVTIRGLPAGETTYTDRVTSGAQYWYRVRGVNRLGSAGGFSNEATAT